jgi:hypothetical protein
MMTHFIKIVPKDDNPYETDYVCTKCDGVNECYCYDPEAFPDPICNGCGNIGLMCHCLDNDDEWDLYDDDEHICLGCGEPDYNCVCIEEGDVW